MLFVFPNAWITSHSWPGAEYELPKLQGNSPVLGTLPGASHGPVFPSVPALYSHILLMTFLPHDIPSWYLPHSNSCCTLAMEPPAPRDNSCHELGAWGASGAQGEAAADAGTTYQALGLIGFSFRLLVLVQVFRPRCFPEPCGVPWISFPGQDTQCCGEDTQMSPIYF